MRVELKDGQWAELRDRINAGDRRAARAAVTVTVQENEARVFSAELEDRVMYALLARLLVGWSLPQPLPSAVVRAEDVLDPLDIDDQEALYQAVRPVYDRIMSPPKQEATVVPGSVSPTGSSDGPAPDAPSLTT